MRFIPTEDFPLFEVRLLSYPSIQYGLFVQLWMSLIKLIMLSNKKKVEHKLFTH